MIGYATTGVRPRFSIRGWDTGEVFVDVGCVCGRDFYSEPAVLNDERGALHLECERCGRRYLVSVLGLMIEPEAVTQHNSHSGA